jgi:long-chain acyl-CoA synthetase
MPAVPRLLNRVYDKIQGEIANSPIKRMLFRMAVNSKEAELRRGIIRRNSLWDKLVFRKVQEAFGGRLRLMVVGSAPLAGNVLTFTRCALGCIVVEGYGQTECVAAVTLTVQGDYMVEHVGPPIACACIKVGLVIFCCCDFYKSHFCSSLMCQRWSTTLRTSKERSASRERVSLRGEFV